MASIQALLMAHLLLPSARSGRQASVSQRWHRWSCGECWWAMWLEWLIAACSAMAFLVWCCAHSVELTCRMPFPASCSPVYTRFWSGCDNCMRSPKYVMRADQHHRWSQGSFWLSIRWQSTSLMRREQDGLRTRESPAACARPLWYCGEFLFL